jgi:hypothetical protein
MSLDILSEEGPQSSQVLILCRPFLLSLSYTVKNTLFGLPYPAFVKYSLLGSFNWFTHNVHRYNTLTPARTIKNSTTTGYTLQALLKYSSVKRINKYGPVNIWQFSNLSKEKLFWHYAFVYIPYSCVYSIGKVDNSSWAVFDKWSHFGYHPGIPSPL